VNRWGGRVLETIARAKGGVPSRRKGGFIAKKTFLSANLSSNTSSSRSDNIDVVKAGDRVAGNSPKGWFSKEKRTISSKLRSSNEKEEKDPV